MFVIAITRNPPTRMSPSLRYYYEHLNERKQPVIFILVLLTRMPLGEIVVESPTNISLVWWRSIINYNFYSLLMCISIDSWITITFGALSVLVAFGSFHLGKKQNENMIQYLKNTDELKRTNEALDYLEAIDRCHGKLTVDYLKDGKQFQEIDYSLQTLSMFLESLAKNYFNEETDLYDAIKNLNNASIKTRSLAMSYINKEKGSDVSLIDDYGSYKEKYNKLLNLLLERKRRFKSET